MPLLLAAVSSFDTVHLPVALLGIDIEQILENSGPWALAVVALIVFVESGVLFPFLPGDSLLFTLGLLHSQLGLNIWVTLGVLLIAAIAGGQVGYYIGHKFGRRMFKPGARILNTKNLTASENFFAKYGGKALVLARFVPVVRTFVPLAAGVANYRYRDFLKWNVIGSILWVILLTVAGVLLGGVSVIRENIDIIAIIIVVVSLLPIVIEFMVERRKSKTVVEILDEEL